MFELLRSYEGRFLRCSAENHHFTLRASSILFLYNCHNKYMVKLLFFILLAIHQLAAAQNTIGIPGIVNYSKQTYNAGSQNWGIAQDKKGIIYFANSQGLLTFD